MNRIDCWQFIFRLTLAGSVLLITGCDGLCIINNGPQFNKTTLQQPILNQVYLETIEASIKNDALDDEYYYTFHTSGDLPAGLIFSSDNRTATISGTPTELGSFSFTVSVNAGASGFSLLVDPTSLCFNDHSELYIIDVAAM